MTKFNIKTSDLEDLADLYICANRAALFNTENEHDIFIDVLKSNITRFSPRAMAVLKREVNGLDFAEILATYNEKEYDSTSPWQFTTDQINYLVTLTVKYAVGRRTYITSQVSNLVKELISYLDLDTISGVLKHIAEASARNALGDVCDYNSWKSLAEVLSEEKKKRVS